MDKKDEIRKIVDKVDEKDLKEFLVDMMCESDTLYDLFRIKFLNDVSKFIK